MERTWLVQRLEKPWRKEGILAGKDNPFTFGGGIKNGGLSDEAMGLIRDIWSFDYMGAAEFEFGAVPKALSGLAENAGKKNLTAFVVYIPLKDIADYGWSSPNRNLRAIDKTTCTTCKAKPGQKCQVGGTARTTPVPHSNRLTTLERLEDDGKGDRCVYILCPKEWANEVAERVRGFAKDGFRSGLKETTQLNRALLPEKDDYPTRVCGWLELDNGFFFFTDEEMWEQACKLFGVEVPVGS